jgi:uncharacterized phage protein (TIGR01671 family)
MNRIIKFRGRVNGQWVYGDYAHGRYISCDGVLHDVDPDTIGQYSGIHDKNGKEIYEGDIVTMMRTPENKNRKAVLTRHIVTQYSILDWTLKSLTNGVLPYLMNGFSDWDSYKMEVIGNIHDNPELTYEETLPPPRSRKKKNGTFQVEFVVKKNPKREPYIVHSGKDSKLIYEVTQDEMNNAIDEVTGIK